MRIEKPNIVAKKSLLPAFKWWRILSFALIIPFVILITSPAFAEWRSLALLLLVIPFIMLFMIIIDCIKLSHQKVEFYNSYVMKKKGVFNKTEEKVIFPKVLGCNVYRSIWGRLFNYGNIKIDAIGRWDVDLIKVKNPLQIRKYIERHFISPKSIKTMNEMVVSGE